MILCVAGNASIDKLFMVDHVTPGSIHRPLEFIQVPGGKGLNVARAGLALGAEVRVVAVLGGHAGRWIEEALAEEGVPGWFAWTSGETRASLSVSDGETGGLTEFYEDGPPMEPGAWGAMEGIVREVLGGASWITMSGSLPPETPTHGYGALIREARKAGVPSALDARGMALATGLAAGPSVTKVNAAEASELLQTPVSSEEEAIAAAAELRRLAGGKDRGALVTRGWKGAVMVGPDGSAWRGFLDAFGPYPVGSGDAFLAGLVTALDRGSPWPQALALALGAAASNAEQKGAGRLDGDRAGELAAKALVEAVE